MTILANDDFTGADGAAPNATKWETGNLIGLPNSPAAPKITSNQLDLRTVSSSMCGVVSASAFNVTGGGVITKVAAVPATAGADTYLYLHSSGAINSVQPRHSMVVESGLLYVQDSGGYTFNRTFDPVADLYWRLQNTGSNIQAYTSPTGAVGSWVAVGATRPSLISLTAAKVVLASGGVTPATSSLFDDYQADDQPIGTAAVPSSTTVPGAPTIGTAVAGNGSASIGGTAPASDGGSAITGYTATSTPGSITGTGATLPITVSGLTNGTAYTFTLHATNSVGSGTESAPSNSVTPAAATITSAVPTGRIFKHSGAAWTSSATGSIVETGTYSGFTPNQIRLVQDGTNTALTGFDWTAITTATGGSYAHTFASVPQGVGTGWYNVQFRDSAVPATIVSTGKRGVGIHIGHYGQSQSSNQFDNFAVVGAPLTPTGMSRVHGGQSGAGTVWNWAVLDPTKNSAIIAADILLNSLTGGKIPIAFLSMGYPGTSLVRGGTAGNWLPTSGALYQYGKTLLAGLEGSVTAMVDIRGESDANNGTVTQAEFYAGLGTLYTQTRTDCGNANLPIVQVMLGSVTSYWTDAAGDLIKKAQVQKFGDANIYRVESYDAPLHTDGLHRNTTGCEMVARRWAQAVAVVLGLASSYRSPRITSVVQVSSTVYDATIAHGLGTDFTPTSGIGGLRVTDSITAAVLTVASATRTAANTIRVTLSAAPTNLPAIAIGYGATVTPNIADNSALAAPLEYSDGVVATALAVSTVIGWTEGAEAFAATGIASAPDTVSCAIGWTEGTEVFAAAGTASAPSAVTATSAWTEGAESFVAAGIVVNPVTAAVAWTEGADVISIAAHSVTQYARAPAGCGYTPQRDEGQGRPGQRNYR